MKTLKKIGIGLIVLILFLVVVSFFLPSKVHVERSIQMKASPESVYKLVVNFKNWDQWSPWHKMDPNWQVTWGEKTEGLGANYSWKSNHSSVGNGRSEIVEATPYESLKMEMYFMEGGKPAYGGWNFEKNDEGVKVTNTMDGDAGMNPFMRWMNLFMNSLVGKHFEDGLNNLKNIVESKAGAENKIAGFDYEMRDMNKMIIAGVRSKIKVAEINDALYGNSFGMIGKVLATEKIGQSGAPMSLTYSYSKESCDMEIAMPVKSIGKGDAKVKFHEVPASKALVVKYYGDYSKIEPVYGAAFEYMGKNKLIENGAPMEMFITDPMSEKDTAKWLTEVVFPIK
jgi:effector-binding domain-containing protein/uncharacterized protein YndB with AHSA1/START domain